MLLRPPLWGLTLLCVAHLVSSLLPNCTKIYIPSDVEIRWTTNIPQWQSNDQDWGPGCKAWADDLHVWDQWLMSLQNWTGKHLKETIFSHHTLHCPHHSRTRKIFIEPLAVALRSPYFPCKTLDTRDTSWLALPSATDIPHRQAYFFDVGTSYYNNGTVPDGSSLGALMDRYEKQGWSFSQIFAWSSAPLDHRLYWDRVPNKVRPWLHLFNTPFSAEPNHRMNPLNSIRKVAQVGDYVALRLDDDNSVLQNSLISQILASPELINLIDEIFWEHRVQFSPMQWHGWGDLSRLKGGAPTLEDSYKTFQKLRKLGIRTHSWV